MPSRKDQSEHALMVRSLARALKEQGHTDIKVDLFGYDLPEQIYWETNKQGETPDVTSTNIKHFIFEVETADSIDDPHTEGQWRLFSAHARQQSKAFVVVVPKGSEKQARQKAAELGIKIDSVWVVE